MSICDAVINYDVKCIIESHQVHALSWGHLTANSINQSITIIKIKLPNVYPIIIIVPWLGMFNTEVSNPVILLIGSFTTYDILLNSSSTEILLWISNPFKTFLSKIINVIYRCWFKVLSANMGEFHFRWELIWFCIYIIPESYQK